MAFSSGSAAAGGLSWWDIDIIGQQPNLKLYTQITLAYPMTESQSASLKDSIVGILVGGLERLSGTFPWVAGQVVEGGDRGFLKIVELGKTPRLVVKDLRGDPSAVTMGALRLSNFPFTMLDEGLLAPRRTLPNPEESALESPVFLVQATFISGGLLLTFVGQHNAMDMTGQGHLIDLLSKACHSEPFTTEEVSTGNLPRHSLVPFLDNYQQGTEIDRLVLRRTLSPPSDPSTPLPPTPPSLVPPKCTWAYFTFDPTSLAALKNLATNTLVASIPFTSTDDSLTAFLWQSITRARYPRLNPTTPTTLGRAVNVRPYFSLPDTYPGILQNMTYTTYTIQNLLTQPLGGVASHLRSALDPTTLQYHTRAVATFLHHTPDRSLFSFGDSIDSSVDLMISSWAKLDCYQLDFNLGLGKPEAVRRPRFDPYEGLIYLMPRTFEGEIAVAVCLRDDDMERLRKDEVFGKYGRYLG